MVSQVMDLEQQLEELNEKTEDVRSRLLHKSSSSSSVEESVEVRRSSSFVCISCSCTKTHSLIFGARRHRGHGLRASPRPPLALHSPPCDDQKQPRAEDDDDDIQEMCLQVFPDDLANVDVSAFAHLIYSEPLPFFDYKFLS